MQKLTDKEWRAFAKAIGGFIEKIENGSACIGWKAPDMNDDAWFSPNMANRIMKATAKHYGVKTP